MVVFMIKEMISIIKNYYSLVDQNKKLLYPYYIGYFLKVVIELAIPICAAKIINNITTSLWDTVFIYIIILLLLNVISNLLSCLNMNAYSNFFQKNYISLYHKIINKIYYYNKEQQKEVSSGKIINSLNYDLIHIGEMADHLLSILLNILKCTIIMIYFFQINLFLSFFLLEIYYIYFKWATTLNKLSIHHLKKQKKANDSLTKYLNQTLTGLTDIQTLNIYHTLDQKYHKLYEDWEMAYCKKRKYQIIRRTILKIILILSKILIYFVCVVCIIKKNLTLETMLLILSYFESLFTSSENILSSIESINEENVSLNRILELLKHNNCCCNTINHLKEGRGEIKFKHIYFHYLKQPILKNINFTIKPNQITAIIGKNGSGKSTIVNLMVKQYIPNAGEILFDNMDIQKIDSSTYLNNVSVLTQNTFLFNLSIRENFNLINNNKKEQEEVCKLLGIDQYIKSLPKGFDTIIEENNINISGGEKRLLSLARTLLKKSKVLILDEATSSLDTKATMKIKKVLLKLKKDHTIIIITHKKEIIKIADQIIKLDNGKSKIIKKETE